jgi:hypothetical protein
VHGTDASHLSKLSGQTTIIKEQVTRSGRGFRDSGLHDDA